uniref:Formin-like protein n=1 Tax=Oryza rufipogon TaxID=4529 RepID=A0A0E0QAK0_ORYRU
MRRRVALSTAIALLVGAQLCVAAEVEVAGAGGGVVRRRSLHQPFFPIEWSPPPPMSGSEAVPPPPPAAAASATTGGGRSTTTVMNTVAIALSAGLVALAVASYSCCLLLRRRRREEEDDGDRAAKRAVGAAAAVAARVPSDVGSSSRQHRSPPPSSTASDAIYLDPLTTLVEVRQHEKSPDLRPLPLLKQPSPDLRPLPPLKRPESQPPPPPPSTPPLTTTGYSTDEEDQATYYTAPKTAMSSFSRSTSQHSTLEQTAMPPMAAPAPPQTNPPRPVRPPPPPPPPRQRLLRPLPAESPPPAALANLELTGSPVKPAVEDRGGENSGAARPPKPPHLKPLHWDKLRAISGRTTVWDQVKNSDTFRVDEEAMESLFLNSGGGGAGSSDPAARRGGSGKQERRLLDPKRLQNVAIMLKSLNVAADEVIGALVRGNPEDLGSEFYETLAKMAPTKEEELKLKGYSGDLSKIDPAERFLKDVLGVPFAFERVDAMLYRANFDNEVNYLRKSFGTLEAACEELRSSKLFLKLLDAVLKTGNRMNDGTNRGEARAFKLDTLLKLADIKSTDGRTTLLHFVVKEIIRSEGFDSDQSAVNPGSGSKEQFKRDGLKLLAGLSSELSNVKRAATLEMDTLSGNILRLEADLEKVKLVLQLKETCSDQGASENFFQAMVVFLRRAEAEIKNMKTAEENALRLVKETTEYFHGDATKEEPHPLRIFVVVDEFLLILDRVCRDVGRTPERVMMGSGKSFRVTAGTSLPPHRNENRRVLSSSDEDSSSC